MLDLPGEWFYQAEIWKCRWTSPQGRCLVIRVHGDRNLLQKEDSLSSLKLLFNRIDALIDSAQQFALQAWLKGENRSEPVPPLTVESISVESWQNIELWFRTTAAGQLLGVRFNGDQSAEPFSVSGDELLS